MQRALDLLAVVPLLFAACESERGEGSDDEDEQVGDSGGASRACVGETRNDFRIGVVRHGASLEVTVMDAMPADPIRGDNVWTLSVSGVGVEGASISVQPWMPDHGHGTPVDATITDLGSGDYRVEPLNLFMAGLWEIGFDLELADGTQDEVMFSVCVE